MIKIVDCVSNAKALENAVGRFREKGIILPTIKQQQNPELVPSKIQEQLRGIGLWEINPLNLFRITWKNEPKEKVGSTAGFNFIELPRAYRREGSNSYALSVNGSPRVHIR